MTAKEELKKAIPSLEDDGSKDIAEQYLLTLEEAEEMENLLANKTFSSVLDRMKADFRARILVLVANDPDLAAMKRMFDRTIGLRGTRERIEEAIREVIENPV